MGDSVSLLIAVAAIQAGFIIAPGSDFALVVRSVARGGKGFGIAVSVGLGAAGLCLIVLSFLGLGSLLEAIPSLEMAIRYAGAAWLLLQAVLSVIPAKEIPKDRNTAPERKGGPFWLGFANQALNVEVIIFYIAVVSQLNAAGISVALKAAVTAEMVGFTILWFSFVSLVLAGVKGADRALNHPISRLLIGALFLVSAAGLVWWGG